MPFTVSSLTELRRKVNCLAGFLILALIIMISTSGDVYAEDPPTSFPPHTDRPLPFTSAALGSVTANLPAPLDNLEWPNPDPGNPFLREEREDGTRVYHTTDYCGTITLDMTTGQMYEDLDGDGQPDREGNCRIQNGEPLWSSTRWHTWHCPRWVHETGVLSVTLRDRDGDERPDVILNSANGRWIASVEVFANFPVSDGGPARYSTRRLRIRTWTHWYDINGRVIARWTGSISPAIPDPPPGRPNFFFPDGGGHSCILARHDPTTGSSVYGRCENYMILPDGRSFEDRNGDGVWDFERGPNGLYVRIDDNFDGVWDREYRDGEWHDLHPSSDTETGTGTGTDTETDTETGTDTDTETDTDSSTDTSTGTSTGTSTDTSTDTDTSTGTSTYTSTDTSTDSSTDTSTYTSIDTSTETEANTTQEVIEDGYGNTLVVTTITDEYGRLEYGLIEIYENGDYMGRHSEIGVVQEYDHFKVTLTEYDPWMREEVYLMGPDYYIYWDAEGFAIADCEGPVNR